MLSLPLSACLFEVLRWSLCKVHFLIRCPVIKNNCGGLILCRFNCENKGFSDWVNTFSPGSHSMGKSHLLYSWFCVILLRMGLQAWATTPHLINTFMPWSLSFFKTLTNKTKCKKWRAWHTHLWKRVASLGLLICEVLYKWVCGSNPASGSWRKLGKWSIPVAMILASPYMKKPGIKEQLPTWRVVPFSAWEEKRASNYCMA